MGDGEATGLHAHLIEAGYSLDRTQWDVLKELFRLFMNPTSTIASLTGYLAERGLNLNELPSVIRSLFDPPRPLVELQTTKPPRGLDTEAQLKAYLGPPLPGYEWHHIIEQGGQWRPDLTSPEGVRTWIQHTANMVMVPVIKHYCINALMSSRFGDLRWRDIAKVHGPILQRFLGDAFLKTCGVVP